MEPVIILKLYGLLLLMLVVDSSNIKKDNGLNTSFHVTILHQVTGWVSQFTNKVMLDLLVKVELVLNMMAYVKLMDSLNTNLFLKEKLKLEKDTTTTNIDKII